MPSFLASVSFISPGESPTHVISPISLKKESEHQGMIGDLDRVDAVVADVVDELVHLVPILDAWCVAA